MKFSLQDVNLDLIQEVAKEHGLEPFAFLKAVMALVEKASIGAPKLGAPETVPVKSLVERAELYVRGMSVGKTIAAYDLAAVLDVGVPQSRGEKRTWTTLVQRVPGLELVRDYTGEPHRVPTDYGRSRLYQRIPLIDHKGVAH